MLGEAIGSYRITKKLGEGGMGVVYLGEHQRIARKAAIKVLLPEYSRKQEVVDRFFREAMATSRIRHPGIVEVTDCDLLPDGSAYIVMELLEGESLGSYLRHRTRLPAAQAVFLARHIADALGAAHDEKIIHRDLKPDNVFVLAPRAAAGSQPIKVVDFGIAKLVSGDGEGTKSGLKTRPGSLMGTPIYMSPEQCRGAGEIDYRSDIYSLGCILFEMIAGRPPFVHEGFGELIQAHLGVVPATLRSLDPTVPEPVDALVAQMLAKAPDARPQTMRDLVRALDAIDAAPPTALAASIMREVVPAAPVTAGQTKILPPAASAALRVETTLRGTSAEKVSSARSGDEAVAAKPRGRAGIVVGLGVAAAVVAALGIWKGTAVPPAPTGGTTPPDPAAELPAGLPAAVPAQAPAAPPAVAAPSPVVAVAATAPARPALAVEPTHAHPRVAASAGKIDKVSKAPSTPSPEKIHVKLVTVPPDVNVCLASDRILLGKTTFDWTAEKGTRTVKLLLRKSGYHGQEISVSAEGDGMRRIELEKLGPDDIDDVVNCKPR